MFDLAQKCHQILLGNAIALSGRKRIDVGKLRASEDEHDSEIVNQKKLGLKKIHDLIKSHIKAEHANARASFLAMACAAACNREILKNLFIFDDNGNSTVWAGKYDVFTLLLAAIGRMEHGFGDELLAQWLRILEEIFSAQESMDNYISRIRSQGELSRYLRLHPSDSSIYLSPGAGPSTSASTSIPSKTAGGANTLKAIPKRNLRVMNGSEHDTREDGESAQKKVKLNSARFLGTKTTSHDPDTSLPPPSTRIRPLLPLSAKPLPSLPVVDGEASEDEVTASLPSERLPSYASATGQLSSLSQVTNPLNMRSSGAGPANSACTPGSILMSISDRSLNVILQSGNSAQGTRGSSIGSGSRLRRLLPQDSSTPSNTFNSHPLHPEAPQSEPCSLAPASSSSVTQGTRLPTSYDHSILKEPLSLPMPQSEPESSSSNSDDTPLSTPALVEEQPGLLVRDINDTFSTGSSASDTSPSATSYSTITASLTKPIPVIDLSPDLDLLSVPDILSSPFISSLLMPQAEDTMCGSWASSPGLGADSRYPGLHVYHHIVDHRFRAEHWFGL